MTLYVENPKDSTIISEQINSANLQGVKSTYTNKLHLFLLTVNIPK